ncbi:MAG: hypothetical protein OHK0036_20940 [Bacteroidia bacterium]
MNYNITLKYLLLLILLVNCLFSQSKKEERKRMKIIQKMIEEYEKKYYPPTIMFKLNKKQKIYYENKIDTMKTREIITQVQHKYDSWDSTLIKTRGKHYISFSSSCDNKDTVFIFINDKLYRCFIPIIDCSTDFLNNYLFIPFGLKKVMKVTILHNNEKIAFYWPSSVPVITIYYFPNLRPRRLGWDVEYTRYYHHIE